ncbi:hypothetical protein [Methanococcoides methylutens]|uniref:Uncharacterized protein n=1 Tax=Methanococcoides methylutens MM1 TaxID=1434104 RepID=A0A0E3X111_METMT|nr:hypothetical protein [Methanococcoides methylutens]AKB85985.1 hypothetical protein MCMEM_1932 [Methanococcoides methylutens MM1]
MKDLQNDNSSTITQQRFDINDNQVNSEILVDGCVVVPPQKIAKKSRKTRDMPVPATHDHTVQQEDMCKTAAATALDTIVHSQAEEFEKKHAVEVDFIKVTHTDGEVNVEVSTTPDNGFGIILAKSIQSRMMIYDNISEQVKDHYFEFHPGFKHEVTEVVA